MSRSDPIDVRQSFDDLNDLEEIDFGTFLSDLHTESAAFDRWSDKLDDYVTGQGALEALRLRANDEAPWPDDNNPMFRYLQERAVELAAAEGLDAAIAWLSRHAWFEATMSERARLSRALVDDE